MLMSGSAGTGLTFAESLTAYNSAWNAIVGFITGNAALMLFLFGGVIAMVWRHFRKAKKAVR